MAQSGRVTKCAVRSQAVPTSATDLLHELEDLKYDFRPAAGARKLELVRLLDERRLPNADTIQDLHEALCFIRAYPENPEILRAAVDSLSRFELRSDLQRFRHALVDTGIAGTVLEFRFFWLMAIRIGARWPDSLTIVWRHFEHKDKLVEWLHLLLPFSESPSLDALDFSPREWIEALKGPNETDATFLIRRFAAIPVHADVRETLYEHLDVPLRLSPGPTTPARGREHWSRAPTVFRKKPLETGRPNLRRIVGQIPLEVRAAGRREARELIDLANACMVSRHRDLLVFLYGDENDVRIVDCGGGLQFACIGAVPERRLMLEAVYGFLTLMNGVPTGYVLCSAFFNSSEVAYNVFETFRGPGTAQTYAAVLTMVMRLFGSDSFAVDPYQLGHDNEEGQKSGAWWFYYKLGFRPHDPEIRRLVREELRKLKKDPGYRTPRKQLQELSSKYMFLHLDKTRTDVLGRLDLGTIGLHINRYLAARFGAQREEGIATCVEETTKLLGLRRGMKLDAGERLAWERWAPLVMTLPGIRRWKADERRALRDVIRTKGGQRESEFVRCFDAHDKLRRSLSQLAREGPL